MTESDTETIDIFDAPSGTREEILVATYRALVEHGYADLTINRIGDKFEKSQSLVYHHYDSKDDVVLSCLEYMLEGVETDRTNTEHEDPRDHLEAILKWGIETDISTEKEQFFSTMLDLRAQTIHREEYRDYFTKLDHVIEDLLSSIIRSGIEQGRFQECDPDAVASTLLTFQNGTLSRRTTVNESAWISDVNDELQRYLEHCVYATE